MGVWERVRGAFPAMLESETQHASAEIAHAIVLPPPAGDAGVVRVLFMCRSNCAEVQGDEFKAGSGNRSFVWYPLMNVGVAEPLSGPQLGYQGSHDPFCSGHTVAADGSVLVVGGLNYVSKCFSAEACIQIGGPGPDDNLPVGHKAVYRLDTTTPNPLSAPPQLPQWVSDETWPALTGREHWYPTAITMEDGDLFIAGHFGAPQPSPECPAEGWEYGSDPAIPRIFERFDMDLAAPTVSPNTPLEPGCTTVAGPASVGHYPRLHLLSSGAILHANALERGVPPEPDRPVSRRMQLVGAPCPTLRWESLGNPALPSSLPAFDRHGGNSVHLLVRDGNQALFPKGVRDVVLAIGGADGDDDAPCPGPGNSSCYVPSEGTSTVCVSISASVQGWNPVSLHWEPRAPMLRKRVNQNAVILPTGSVLVIGGTGLVNDAGPICEAVLLAEEFFPSEIFGGPSEGVWLPRALMARPRGYHAVAGLLPDGRVFVAGGNDQFWIGHASGVYHTVEIFEPSYYGRGDRPIVTSWPEPVGSPIAYSDPNGPEPVTFDVDVTLTCTDPTTVYKVVLIRSGSSTHAFDMNQRYVELQIDDTVVNGSSVSVRVIGPADGFVAPPGYYLLFLVDSNGLPSEGRWVRVGNV